MSEQEPVRSPVRDVVALMMLIFGVTALTTGFWLLWGPGAGLSVLGASLIVTGILLGL